MHVRLLYHRRYFRWLRASCLLYQRSTSTTIRPKLLRVITSWKGKPPGRIQRSRAWRIYSRSCLIPSYPTWRTRLQSMWSSKSRQVHSAYRSSTPGVDNSPHTNGISGRSLTSNRCATNLGFLLLCWIPIPKCWLCINHYLEFIIGRICFWQSLWPCRVFWPACCQDESSLSRGAVGDVHKRQRRLAWTDGNGRCGRHRAGLDDRYGRWAKAAGRLYGRARQCWPSCSVCSIACNHWSRWEVLHSYVVAQKHVKYSTLSCAW